MFKFNLQFTNKKDLKEDAGISSASVAQLGKCENITTDVLLKICVALNVHLEDIMEKLTINGGIS